MIMQQKDKIMARRLFRCKFTFGKVREGGSCCTSARAAGRFDLMLSDYFDTVPFPRSSASVRLQATVLKSRWHEFT